MIRYKDFATGKQKFSRGTFDHWERGGPLNAWLAIVTCRASALAIPSYCLTPESRKALPAIPQEEDKSSPC